MGQIEKREALVEYLKMKTKEADWHAVSDAANDLRVLEASCNHKFLVQSGIRVQEVTLNDKRYTEISIK